MEQSRKLRGLEEENKRLRLRLDGQHQEVMDSLPEKVSNQEYNRLMSNFDIHGIQQIGGIT